MASMASGLSLFQWLGGHWSIPTAVPLDKRLMPLITSSSVISSISPAWALLVIISWRVLLHISSAILSPMSWVHTLPHSSSKISSISWGRLIYLPFLHMCVGKGGALLFGLVQLCAFLYPMLASKISSIQSVIWLESSCVSQQACN